MQLLNNRYEKVARLGEGSYGTVYKAIDKKPQGVKRTIDPKFFALFCKIEDEKTGEAERAECVATLQNKELVFGQNEAFQAQENDSLARNREAEEEKQKSGEAIVAIKKVKMNAFNERDGIDFTALREIKLLQELRHPNIIGLYDVFYVQKTIFLVLDYMETDLAKLIQNKAVMLKEEHIKNIMLQILNGLAYLHSNFIMHRDLSPANLMIDSGGIIKFIDFGLARFYGSPGRAYTTGVVTRFYRPPEILYGAKHYGPAVDVWSAGCILAELLLRSPLFPGSTDIDQLGKIFTVLGNANEETWPGVSELPNYLEFTIQTRKDFKEILPFASQGCLDLLDGMLQLDPNKRISAAEAMEHPFFKE